MKYRVKNGKGDSVVCYSIDEAHTTYCAWRCCSTCRLSGSPGCPGCADCTDEELLRRFGAAIEVIHDDDPAKPAADNDPVNHPAHYTAGGIECIDAIAAALTCQRDPMCAWLTGQVLKYLWRWPLKNGVEDLKKARFYLDRLIGKVEGHGEEEQK